MKRKHLHKTGKQTITKILAFVLAIAMTVEPMAVYAAQDDPEQTEASFVNEEETNEAGSVGITPKNDATEDADDADRADSEGSGEEEQKNSDDAGEITDQNAGSAEAADEDTEAVSDPQQENGGGVLIQIRKTDL